MTPPVATTLEEANEIIAALFRRVRELEAKVAELESRLRRNSTNSSRPPSSDPLWSKPKRKPPEAPSGRKPGGQPGHVGRARDPVPPEEVDEVVDVYPERCTVCGHEFADHEDCDDAHAHQVTDLPEARARVTEYRLWRKRCPKCGGRTRASRPSQVSPEAFGPRLKATIAALTARYRMSRREVVEVLRDLYGVDVSVGSVQAVCEEVSEAVAPVVSEVKAEVEQSPSIHADETGWRQKGEMHWLWTGVVPDAALFELSPDRGRAALSKLLSEACEAVVHSDRWVAYERFPVERRQLCHSHLRRDFQAAIDRGGEAKPVGRRLLEESDRMFKVWHAFERGEMDRAGLVAAMEPVQEGWDEGLRLAFESPDRKLQALGRSLWEHWDALWTFVRVEGVEPTNNDAERALRKAVLWRKGSFGTQSDRGSLFAARMLTVIETAKRRKIPFLDWLVRVCRASATGLDPPPLVAT